jgi:hypothetical protein
MARPEFELPSEEAWQEFLEELAEGGKLSLLAKKHLGTNRSTLWFWRQRNPERNAEIKAAIAAKCELYDEQLEEIADRPDDGDNNVKQGRDKIRIDFRMNYLKAHSPNWKPKTEVDVTTKGEKLTNGIDELGRRAILAAAEQISSE